MGKLFFWEGHALPSPPGAAHDTLELRAADTNDAAIPVVVRGERCALGPGEAASFRQEPELQ
jgi:hypothetical protein